MRSFLSRIVVWMMALCLTTAPLMADTQAAMLYANGKVTVNGTAVARSTGVFAGDKIRTGGESTVIISLKGSTVQILQNSGAVFEAGTITVNEGTATVATSSGLTVAAGSLRISPAAEGSARFQVIQQKGTVRVAALAGRLSISDGKQVTLLDPGRQLTTAPAGMPGVPQGASSLAGATIALIVAVVAGTSAAAAIVSTRDKQDTSPSTFNSSN